MISDLIYGKDKTKKITYVGYDDTDGCIKLQTKDGESSQKYEPYLITFNQLHRGKVGELYGDLPLNNFAKFEDKGEWYRPRREMQYGTYFGPRRFEEQYMVKEGVTCFKDMDYSELSIMAFDIETTTLNPSDDKARILLITMSYRPTNGKKTINRVYNIEDFADEERLIAAWEADVQKYDPDVLAGHNIFGFDLPYIAKRAGRALMLGRASKSLEFEHYKRKFRKDGSQFYEYSNVLCFGRNIIDTFFLSIKYDVGRKYPNYKLKDIIKYEGLARKGRQYYEAVNLGEKWLIVSERAKIIEYAKDDAEEVIKLLDLMLPQYFYYTRSVPMNLQEVILTNSGKQIDYMMCRAYLQEKHSLPVATKREEFQGAISFGNPGLYKHVNKVDVASLYPSIMLSYKIGLETKDPKNYFHQILDGLTKERLANKAKAKETGERHYDDIQQAQKIIINSAYGFMGATGLLFNNPKNAAEVTKRGREILKRGIDWAEKKNVQLVNVDTDSFSYTTGSRLSDEDFRAHIEEVNRLSPEGIVWEDDGQYKAVLVVKAKNYILEPYKGSRTIKGSALKATTKEPALREYIERVVDVLIKDHKDELFDLYDKYAIEIYDVQDIARWASKKTITDKVLKPQRTNEQRIFDALNGRPVSEGDKVFVFFERKDKLSMVDDFSKVYCRETLWKKLFKTTEIFDSIIDVSMFPNYSLKRNHARIITKGENYATCNNFNDYDIDQQRIRTRSKLQSAVTNVRKTAGRVN